MLPALGVVAIVAALLLAARPRFAEGRRGMFLSFAALVGLPLIVTIPVADQHLQQSKSTQFCLSCHEMGDYGRSLMIDDSEYLPAVHYQNRLIDRDHACYTCHTSYTMYGDIDSKVKGLKHVWVHYLGEPPEEIELYEPYHNRECLYCHQGARPFEENEDHQDEAEAIASGETSCLDCHDLVHAVDELDDQELWQEGGS